MPAARKNISRSYELNLIGYSLFKECYNDFLEYLKSHSDGSIFSFRGVSFHFGNINRLVNYLDLNKDISSIDIPNIKEAYHIDSISAECKKKLLKEYGFNKGEFNKSDILIIAEKEYLISIKDTSTTCKLAQKSGEITINDTKLKGGLVDPTNNFMINKTIKYTDTNLTQKQFSKLNNKDKTLSYIKKEFPKKWDNLVVKTLEDAYSQLLFLQKSLKNSNTTLVSLVKLVLTNSLTISENFYIWLDPNLCSVKNIIEIISDKKCQINAEIYKTANKQSLVITIEYNKKEYGITKIEPSFEGARDHISQTKGIIYHFQQCNSTNGSIWDLINASN